MGIEVPEQYGGAGGSLFMVTLAVEEISKVDAAAAIVCDVQNTLVNYPINRYGSEAQKSKYLPMLASEVVGAYALSESGSGSDAFGLARAPEKRGDRWILNGQKLWITNGAEAGIFVVFANADPVRRLPRDHGVHHRARLQGLQGRQEGRQARHPRVEHRGAAARQLRGPEENVLGPVGQGYKIAINTLNGGRIGIGAQMIGVAQGALNATIKYLSERKQFGKSLSEFQGIQFQIAQAATEVEAARLMVYNAARLKDAGQDIAREGAMAKLFSSQVCERVTSLCVELFGGYGYTKDYPVEKFYRDAKIGTIYEGTSNMQLQTIAKAILK